jgi:hypothetical protein
MAAMRAYRCSIPLAVLLLHAGSTSASTGGLHKVWEVDLRKLAIPRSGHAGLPVFALRFSPDGKKLAVIAGVYGSGQERESRLLVIHTENPSVNVQEFDIPFGVLEDEHGRGHALNFGWAPSGQIVYALGKIIHLQSGESCELPNQSVLISDDIAVLAQPYPPPVYSSTRLIFFDQRCEKQGEWDVEGGWLIMDVSTDRHLLSIASSQGHESGLTQLIVDPLARRTVRSWPWKDIWGPAWEFADSGKTVCVAGNPAQGEPSPATCRNVDTGLEIAKTTRNGDEPIAVASYATRLIASEYRSKHIGFGLEFETTLQGRYVWDFASGKELASWYPPFETYPNVFSAEKQVTEPFRFAISPDGQYVAEGGDGTIRLFRIGP